MFTYLKDDGVPATTTTADTEFSKELLIPTVCMVTTDSHAYILG